MLIGRKREIKADMPHDPSWDNWRKFVNKKNSGNLQMKISIGPKGM